MKKKNNQAKSYFSYKNDDVDLVEVGQFLRDTFKYRVEREWYIVLDKMSGKYMGFTRTVPDSIMTFKTEKVRNPDLILIDKDTYKLKLIIEIDGGIHDKKFFGTEKRNEEYFFAGLPLLVINKSEIETTIFDLVNKKVRERIDN